MTDDTKEFARRWAVRPGEVGAAIAAAMEASERFPFPFTSGVSFGFGPASDREDCIDGRLHVPASVRGGDAWLTAYAEATNAAIAPYQPTT